VLQLKLVSVYCQGNISNLFSLSFFFFSKFQITEINQTGKLKYTVFSFNLGLAVGNHSNMVTA